MPKAWEEMVCVIVGGGGDRWGDNAAILAPPEGIAKGSEGPREGE